MHGAGCLLLHPQQTLLIDHSPLSSELNLVYIVCLSSLPAFYLYLQVALQRVEASLVCLLLGKDRGVLSGYSWVDTKSAHHPMDVPFQEAEGEKHIH